MAKKLLTIISSVLILVGIAGCGTTLPNTIPDFPKDTSVKVVSLLDNEGMFYNIGFTMFTNGIADLNLDSWQIESFVVPQLIEAINETTKFNASAINLGAKPDLNLTGDYTDTSKVEKYIRSLNINDVPIVAVVYPGWVNNPSRRAYDRLLKYGFVIENEMFLRSYLGLSLMLYDTAAQRVQSISTISAFYFPDEEMPLYRLEGEERQAAEDAFEACKRRKKSGCRVRGRVTYQPKHIDSFPADYLLMLSEGIKRAITHPKNRASIEGAVYASGLAGRVETCTDVYNGEKLEKQCSMTIPKQWRSEVFMSKEK